VTVVFAVSSSDDDDFQPTEADVEEIDDDDDGDDGDDDEVGDDFGADDNRGRKGKQQPQQQPRKPKKPTKPLSSKPAPKARGRPRASKSDATAGGVAQRREYLSSSSEDVVPPYRHQVCLSSSSDDGERRAMNAGAPAAAVAADAPMDVNAVWDHLKHGDDDALERPLDAAALQAASAAAADGGARRKVTITETYDYAGEAVVVTRTVDADEALKRKSTGLEDVVGGLKKKKLSAMSKSHVDWEAFKDKEGLQDELRLAVNAGNSYLDREDFLQRADVRQFELERDVREQERQRRQTAANSSSNSKHPSA
jgi:hypothetical protein